MAEKPAKQARKRTAAPRASKRSVGHEQIATRAYFIYLEEGHRDPVANWLRAEREMTAA